MKRSRRPHRTLRFVLGTGVIVTLLILGSVVGFKSFRHWQGRRFVRRAETYLSWGDNKSATLSARQVLDSDPANAGALRIMAVVAEREQNPVAIDWRQKIIENNPESVSDAVALAKAAIQFGALDKAQPALDRIAPKAEKIPQYQEALGQLAAAGKNFREARTHFAEAVKLKPDDPLLRVQLAIVQLRSTDPAEKREATQTLQRLLDDKTVRLAAAKNLLQTAVEERDSDVVHYAEILRNLPEASFQDRLLCLQLFHQLQLSQFATALLDMQTEAAQDSNNLTTLLSWMSNNHLSIAALEWIRSLPNDLLRKRPVFVAVADCEASIKDWAALQEWCEKGEWTGLESLRHAYLALALRGNGDSIDADLEWSKAVKQAPTIEEVETLQRAAAKWDWKKESIDLLWSLANSNTPKQRTALDTLYRYYGEQGDTASLYRVAVRLSHVAPDDPQVQNNFAQLSLLLKADMDRARALAHRVYDEHKNDPNFASTYAFALFTQQLPDQAVKVMDTLNPDELKRPEIAAYYGMMLAGTGDRSKAQPYLELGKKARLLPEEKKLFDEAFAR